jgi:hypothetical protein
MKLFRGRDCKISPSARFNRILDFILEFLPSWVSYFKSLRISLLRALCVSVVNYSFVE